MKPIVNQSFLKKHELLNKILPKKFPKNTNLRCLFIGDSKIGKTSFLYYCSCNEFPTNILPKFIEPVKKNVIILNKQYSLEMNDFESLQYFKKIAPNTDIIFECFSVDSSESFDNIFTQWNPLVDKYSPKAIKILIGMKCDVKRDEDYIKQLILNNEFYITNKQVISNSITKGK
jgi:GTPase SAR1 family protein